MVGPDVRDRGTTFKTKFDLVEAMGAEFYVHFGVGGGEIEASSQMDELLKDQGGIAEASDEADNVVVARLDAESKAKTGEQTELWVDATKMHFFDADSGQSLLAVGQSAACSASLGPSEALAAVRSGSLREHQRRPSGQRQLVRGEVDRDQEFLPRVQARMPGPASIRALLAGLQRRGLLAQARERAGEVERRARVLGLRGGVEGRRLGHERQPRASPVVKPWPGASGVHGIGARSGSRPSTSTTRSGGIGASGSPSSSPW